MSLLRRTRSVAEITYCENHSLLIQLIANENHFHQVIIHACEKTHRHDARMLWVVVVVLLAGC